jgi:hypothetical protein
MTAKEIEATLTAHGVLVNPWVETFQDAHHQLEWYEVIAMLPGATEVEIASYCGTKARQLRQQRYDLSSKRPG